MAWFGRTVPLTRRCNNSAATLDICMIKNMVVATKQCDTQQNSVTISLHGAHCHDSNKLNR